MDKQIVGYSYNRIYLNNEKEWNTDTHNMNEFQKH